MKNQLIIKIVLIVISEAIAMVVTKFVSNNIIYIPHTNVTYIICGGVLAYFVVVMYDRYMTRKKDKIQEDIKVLADLALQNYKVGENKR